MLQVESVIESWREQLKDLNNNLFNYQVVKPDVDKWIEENIYLEESTTVRPGFYDFNFTPYMREIVGLLHPSNPVRFFSIMKDGQSGFTTALVIGGILYIISECPTSILFTAADINLAQKTIEERFDPVLRSSKLDHLIRPNVIKKTNNRTGDTSKKKEFRGGVLTTAGTNSANTFRMFSAQIILNDDYDTAPKEIGKEGSPKQVMKTRQNSFGDSAKTGMISTPTNQFSNIWAQIQLGTMEWWNWICPACEGLIKIEWKTECPDGTLAGIVWKLDDNKNLIRESVKYKCPHCSHLIDEKEKYDLNLKSLTIGNQGWVPTVTDPIERNHRSFIKNFIYNPPGFDGWVTGVEEFLAACPPGERVNVLLLKTFYNLRLGLPFEEQGETISISGLMENTRSYLPGVIPDITCEKDGNGKIIMLTLACDINGIMKELNEDIRLDWELLAHSSTGVTYSVDHGSIGTFKRIRDKTGAEKEDEENRKKWTITHGDSLSVWNPFEEIMRKRYPVESSFVTANQTSENPGRSVDITVIDTGFGSNLVMQFVQRMYEDGLMCIGVKGRIEDNYRKLTRDTQPIKRSAEKPRHLYIVEVNQIKDDLAQYMALRQGEDGSFPSGYMNYPEPRDNKYTKKSYFSHYEGEKRLQVKNDAGDVIGFQWQKKNNQVQNHFWDVRVYNLVAPLIFFDIFKQFNPSKYKNYTWEDFVMLMTG